MKRNLLALPLFVAIWAATPLQAQSLQIKQLAASCFSCHGTDGYSVGGMASLAGYSKASFIEKMAGYKSGKVEATIMHQLSKGYSDEQIEKLADYFAALPKEKPVFQPANKK